MRQGKTIYRKKEVEKMKRFAAIIALCCTLLGSAQAVSLNYTPAVDAIPHGMTAPPGYFFPAALTGNPCNTIVTEDGMLWDADISLPAGPCIVMRNTFSDLNVENDSIAMIIPVKK